MIHKTGITATNLITIPDNISVFGIGDVHGQADAFYEMLTHIKNTDTGDNHRILVHTGDIADRGPQNLKSIEYLLDAQNLAGVDEVCLLPGNHELMYFDALSDPMDEYLWLQNGGYAVFKEMSKISSEHTLQEQHNDILDLCRWKTLIQQSPSHYQIGNVIFVHAGVGPLAHYRDTLALTQDDHRNETDHWAWVRDNEIRQPDSWDGNIIVHGHTPALRPGAITSGSLAVMNWLGVSRINIDAGAAHSPQVGAVLIENGKYEIMVAVS
jgi:serine/threonine protein phosphatase 1